MTNRLLWTFFALNMATLGISETNALPPIVVGVSNVQSGPSRSLGQELVQGSVSYFNLLNSSGGIHGRKVLMILKDDHYEPEPAIQNTNDLITKDHAFFLFDYVGTPTLTRVLPLLRYYQERSIVNVAPFTGADAQRTPPYDTYVFNIRASYREEAHYLVEYLYSKGFRRIGFLGQSDAYGKNGQVGVAEALQKHGLTIIASVAYRRNQESSGSMRTQVDYLRSKGADAVIAVGVYGPCTAFIRDARVAGWQIPIANVSFVNSEAMLGLLRVASKAAHLDLTLNLINSQVVPDPINSQCPLAQAYRAHLGGVTPGFTSLEGWLNAVVVAEALKRAGLNPSREAFIRAMESLNGWDPGIGYKLQFSHTDHQALHKVWLTKSRNAGWVSEASPEGMP